MIVSRVCLIDNYTWESYVGTLAIDAGDVTSSDDKTAIFLSNVDEIHKK